MRDRTLSIQRGTYIPVINPPVECPVDSSFEAWAQNLGGNAEINGSASSYSQRAVTVPVVNGAGGTKTELVFDNTLISDNGQGTLPSIHATGTLEINSPSGGTYTLVP